MFGKIKFWTIWPKPYIPQTKYLLCCYRSHNKYDNMIVVQMNHKYLMVENFVMCYLISDVKGVCENFGWRLYTIWLISPIPIFKHCSKLWIVNAFNVLSLNVLWCILFVCLKYIANPLSSNAVMFDFALWISFPIWHVVARTQLNASLTFSIYIYNFSFPKYSIFTICHIMKFYNSSFVECIVEQTIYLQISYLYNVHFFKVQMVSLPFYYPTSNWVSLV